MFIFNVENMLNELKENYSGYDVLKDLPKITDDDYTKKLDELYPQCESISIDYAVMEKSNSIYVIPSDFGWDDIGTWMSLLRYIKPDKDGNYIKGNVTSYDSKGNIVYSDKKKIILLDIEDIFCIDSEDVLVIGNRESLKKVHELRNK